MNYLLYLIVSNLKIKVMNTEDSKLVQMRLQSKTLESIKSLGEMTNTKNKTQLVSSSIKLTEDIVSSIQAGAKVYIENKDGTRELIKIIGL